MKIKSETKIKFFRNFLFLSVFTILILHSNLSFAEFSLDGVFLQDCYAQDYKMETNVKSSTFDFMSPLLVGVLQLFGMLINLAMQLIMLTFEDTFLNIISDNAGIYAGWSVVRDILNLFFIFFLLYSAFCTIFQISRYHIKSTWVMIVVMALLVNFSWPITRVLIDVSNLSMMYLIGGDSSKMNGLTSKFGTETDFLTLMLGTESVKTGEGGIWPWSDKSGTEVNASTSGFFSRVLFGILIAALFLITFLTVAIMLILRIIVLAVLLVFAPVGFTLAAFPSTRAQASSWWSALMKQLIAGPILLFCLVVSVAVLSSMEIKMESAVNVKGAAAQGVQTVMQFIVSIVLVWTGIMAAQKVGADGADMALGFANKAKGKMQGWGKAAATGTALGAVKVTARTGDLATGGLASAGVAKAHGVLSGVRQRFKSADQEYKDRYAEKKDAASAYTQAVGTGIGTDKPDGTKAHWAKRYVGKATGYGGDKNAIAANKGKQIEAEKKRMKETPLNEAIDIKTEAKAQTLIEKKDNVTEDNIKELIKSLDKLDGDTRKLALKKARETGYGHLTMDHEMAELRKKNPTLSDSQIRQDAAEKIFSGMDAKTLARQKVMQEYAKDGGNQNLRAGFEALEAKRTSLSVKSQNDFQDALNREQVGHLAAARRTEAANSMRDMNS